MTAEVTPLFVFGVARSGTNLVTRILNGHSEIAIALDPLLPMFKALRNANVASFATRGLAEKFDGSMPFQDYYFNDDDLRVLDILLAGRLDLAIPAESIRDIVSAICRRAGLESESLSAGLSELNGSTYREIIDGVLAVLVHQSGKSEVRWAGSKELWTAEFIPLLARAYPKARFVVIRRDPRAVVASLEVMSAKDPSQAAHTVSYMRHWRKEVAVISTLQSDKSLSERLWLQSYEAFVTEPQVETRNLCRFLDIEYSDFLLDPLDADGTPWRGNSSYQEVRGVSRGSIERWRQHDSPGMARTVEFHCAPEMKLSGYALEYPPDGIVDESVNRYVMWANENPGSWRSDSGVPRRDIEREEHRWALIKHGPETPVPKDARRNFLFEDCFRHVASVMG